MGRTMAGTVSGADPWWVRSPATAARERRATPISLATLLGTPLGTPLAPPLGTSLGLPHDASSTGTWDLWCFHADDLLAAMDPTWVTVLQGWLDPEERSRWQRFKFAQDRDRFWMRRSVLRLILAQYTGQAPGAIAFRTGPQGKPDVIPAPPLARVSPGNRIVPGAAELCPNRIARSTRAGPGRSLTLIAANPREERPSARANPTSLDALPDQPADSSADSSASISADSSANLSADISANISADSSANLSADISANISANISADSSANLSADISANLSADISADISANISADSSANLSADISADISTVMPKPDRSADTSTVMPRVAPSPCVGLGSGQDPLAFTDETNVPPSGFVQPVRFSLSKSGPWVAIAVGGGDLGAIGLDVEQVPILDHAAADADGSTTTAQLVQTVLPPAEYAAYLAISPAHRAAAWLHLWTIREASVKAEGVGLGGLERLRVMLSSHWPQVGPVEVTVGQEATTVQVWPFGLCGDGDAMAGTGAVLLLGCWGAIAPGATVPRQNLGLGCLFQIVQESM